MKKIIISFAIIAIITVSLFTTCDDGTGGNTGGNNDDNSDGNSSSISVISVPVYTYNIESGSATNIKLTGSGKVYIYYYSINDLHYNNLLRKDEIGTMTNGNLSFTLSKVPPVDGLFKAGDFFKPGIMGSGIYTVTSGNINIVPSNTKINIVFPEAQGIMVFVDNNQEEYWLGRLKNENASRYFIIGIYSDNNVTIKGDIYYTETDDDNYIDSYNITLVKGWNIVFYKDGNEGTIFKRTWTSSIPVWADDIKWTAGEW